MSEYLSPGEASASRAMQLMDTYMMRNIDRARQANEYARTELKTDYDARAAQLKYLQDTLTALREQREALDSELIQFRELAVKGEEAGVKNEEYWKTIRELLRTKRETATSVYTQDNVRARNRVDAQSLVMQMWEGDDPAKKAASDITEATRGLFSEGYDSGRSRKGAFTDRETTQGAIHDYLQDAGTMTATLKDRPRQAIAIDAYENIMRGQNTHLGADARLSPAEVKREVALAFGVDVAAIDGAVMRAQMDAEEEAMQSMAGASGGLLKKEYAFASEEYDRLLQEAMQEASVTDAAKIAPDEWAKIRADLDDDGVLNTVSPELVEAYNRGKAVGSGTIPKQDEIYYDELFLRRLRNRAEMTAEMDTTQQRMGSVDMRTPTEEDVRRRATGILAPGRPGRPLIGDRRKAEFDEETAKRQAAFPGPTGAVNTVDRPPQPDDKDRVLSAAVVSAAKRPRKHSPSQTAQTIWQQIQVGAFDRKQLLDAAAAIAQGDKGVRDDLMADVIWLDTQDAASRRP